MFNNSFKIGDSNTNLGQNSTIIGGNGNHIGYGAVNVSLQSCTGVVVRGDVSNFTGVGLPAMIIDKSYSGKVLIFNNAPRIKRVTANFSIDGLYDIYEIDLDSIGVAITCTWDVYNYPIKVTFKVVANASVADFKITDNGSPSTTIDGSALPYTTGLATYGKITVYSNKAKLYTI